MLKILQARIQQCVSQEPPNVQAGFRKGRRTRDQIANIRWITEKARTFQKKKKTKKKTSTSASLIMLNDCVDHNKLWKILRIWNTRVSYLSPEKSAFRSRLKS